MHRRLIEEGFNRRYVLGPLLLAITLVVMGYAVTEMRRTHARVLADTIRERQDVIRVLTEAGYRVMEAESAQRGFVLTGEQKYVTPLESGLAEARLRLDELAAHYRKLDPEQLPVIDRLQEDLDVKALEMRQSVALLREGRPREALAVVKSDLGLYQMFAISEALGSLRARERALVLAGLNDWEATTRINTIINTCNLAFTVAILLILGLLATRDIRRRNIFATALAAQIDERTAELRDLSRHMSRVAETEKHALARELHDELGGLLVAMRMDLVQIRKQLGKPGDPELQPRWERIEQALAQGLELKRRVIEDLRPTLLDNMGLFTALRWLATQSSETAQLGLEMEGLDEDIDVPPETAIAVFRTVQEALANIVKHSGATRFMLKAKANANRLFLTVTDDGRGVPPQAERRAGSHGLKQMRFRMEAVGGDLSIEPGETRGTVIRLSVPLD